MKLDYILYILQKISYYFLFWPKLDSRGLIFDQGSRMQPCQSENVFGGDIQNGGYLVHKYEKSDAFTGKSENGTPSSHPPLPGDAHSLSPTALGSWGLSHHAPYLHLWQGLHEGPNSLIITRTLYIPQFCPILHLPASQCVFWDLMIIISKIFCVGKTFSLCSPSCPSHDLVLTWEPTTLKVLWRDDATHRLSWFQSSPDPSNFPSFPDESSSWPAVILSVTAPNLIIGDFEVHFKTILPISWPLSSLISSPPRILYLSYPLPWSYPRPCHDQYVQPCL